MALASRLRPADSQAAAGRSPRVLMLIPSYVKRGIEPLVAADQHPTMDYHALQAELDADITDYASVDIDRRLLVRLARKAGRDAALAMIAYLDRGRYDAVFSNGENVSMPLAALFRTAHGRPAHVLIGHRLSAPKKRALLRSLHGQMDHILVYSTAQRRYAVERLGMAEGKVIHIPFHADHRFFRPLGTPQRHTICSAGLEWRDYPTLLQAVDGLDMQVRLAAASPWSKHRNSAKGRKLPTNVTARRYEYLELRSLYAESAFVVVPLYDTDFQAGVTTMLEAMAMGRAVIATRTIGQSDVIEEGVNGLYVPPGDPCALRAAIERLAAEPREAQRLGAAGRTCIEQDMTLDHWVRRVAEAVRSASRLRTI